MGWRGEEGEIMKRDVLNCEEREKNEKEKYRLMKGVWGGASVRKSEIKQVVDLPAECGEYRNVLPSFADLTLWKKNTSSMNTSGKTRIIENTYITF